MIFFDSKIGSREIESACKDSEGMYVCVCVEIEIGSV